MSFYYFQQSLPPSAGFYYRMPINLTNTIYGQILPKYFTKLTMPYFGVIYPIGDQYAGLMLVKTTQPLQMIAMDIEILTRSYVQIELHRIENQEIAL